MPFRLQIARYRDHTLLKDDSGKCGTVTFCYMPTTSPHCKLLFRLQFDYDKVCNFLKTFLAYNITLLKIKTIVLREEAAYRIH